jgi:hypothetical protein
VAENGYDLFLDKLTPKLLTKDLPKHLEELNK